MTRDPYMGICIMPGCENYVTHVDPDLAYALNPINAKYPHVCQCHTKEAGGHIYATKDDSAQEITLYCERKDCYFEVTLAK